MKTFINKNFEKRNYECTNIVFCQAEQAPGDNWVECDSSELASSTCSALYIQGRVRYFGWL